MTKLARILLVALAVTACRSAAPAPSRVPNRDWEPLAAAISPCGRYTLRLEQAEWRSEPGQRPRLMLQMSLVTGEPDVMPCGQARVTDLVPPDGTEFHEAGLKGFAHVDSRSGSIVFSELEPYHEDRRLTRLRVECRVLRVLSWRSYAISCAGPGDEREFICPPYHIGVSADETGCHVSAFCTTDRSTFPAAERDLFGILGHDWVAESASLVDANGQPLTAWGGGGSGGFTTMSYGPASWLSPGGAEPLSITYPVTGTIRLPERYVVEVVPFEFLDCPLARPDGSPAQSLSIGTAPMPSSAR